MRTALSPITTNAIQRRQQQRLQVSNCQRLKPTAEPFSMFVRFGSVRRGAMEREKPLLGWFQLSLLVFPWLHHGAKLRYCPIPLHISPIPPRDSRAFPRVRPDMNPLVAVGPDGQVRMNQEALKRAKARACAGRGRCNSVTGGRVWIC